MEFKAWPKITRVENRRAPTFTEKIDGTNACIVWSFEEANQDTIATVLTEVGPLSMWAQSRSRFITPENDNFGFARWTKENFEDLAKLGEGHHFGEWWGLGIQREYQQTEKKFSLFNTRRWNENNPNRPACVSVVPILPVSSIEQAREYLRENGSVVAPGFMNVEGAVMFEPDSESLFKIIINK